MPSVDLTKFTVADLIERQQAIMAKRAEAEAGFKAEARTVRLELDRREAIDRVGNVLAELSPDDQRMVLDALRAREG